MIKRPFLTFITVVSILIAGLLWFIQSSSFAKVFKSVAARYIPKDTGVFADFSEFSIQLFPPGFSVRNPKVHFGARNITSIPEGSSVSVERIDFIFRPFQIFSGNIRIHQVHIVNGAVQLWLDPASLKKKPKTKTKRLDLHWDELLQIRADSIALENIDLKILFSDSPQVLNSSVKFLSLAQGSGRGGPGYLVHLSLEKIEGSYLKTLGMPESLPQLRCDAYMNASGLQLENLILEGEGIEVNASGLVRGSLLDLKSAEAEANLKVKGDLTSITRKYFPTVVSLRDLTGAFSWVGKVTAKLDRFLESVHAEGHGSIRNFSYQNWKSDRVEVEAQWLPESVSGGTPVAGGELHLSRLTFVSKMLPRMGGFQPGDGGKIEIGPTRWSPGSPLPVTVPIAFEGAHLHWVGAAALKYVYPLDFRLNGNIQATFQPPVGHKSWELGVQFNNAWLENFQLDNQRYQKNKPLSRLFQVPKIGLTGMVTVNPSELKPMNFQLGLPHTKLRTSGKIDFKKGYDLNFSGPIKLDDLGQIAENDIRGEGSVNGRVYGPSSNVQVDIDLDLQEAYYLKLFLGNLKGRITWDDDLNLLYFKQVKLRKETTPYLVDGKLDFNAKNTADLTARIEQGNIQDFINIFQNLTKDLNWFPKQLNGPMTGILHVKGEISLAQIQILTQINGTNWDYLGEKFKATTLDGGFDKGKYILREFSALKRFGKILGNISYDADHRLDWNFHTDDLVVSDFDHVAQLDVPMRGRVRVTTSGSGKLGEITSETELNLTDFAVRGLAKPPSQMTINTAKGVIQIQSSLMGGQGIFDSVYDFNSKEVSQVRIELKHLDFSPVLLLLNPKSIHDKLLAGSISGQLQLNFHSGEIEKANGLASLSDYSLVRSDARFQLGAPVEIQINQGSFRVDDLKIQGKSGEVDLTLESRSGKLEGTIYGNLDLSFVEFFTSSVLQALGTASLDFAIGGTLIDPNLSGRARLEGGSIRMASLESPFENVTGLIQFRQNLVFVQNVQADLGGGRVNMNGQIIPHADRYPEVNLKADLKSTKVKIFPFQYAQVSGTLGIKGEQSPYLIDGTLAVESALSKEKILNRKSGGGEVKAYQYSPPPTKALENNFSKFKMNIRVEAQKGIEIQNDLFRDVQAKGSLTLVNTLDAPRVLGRAEVVQGKVLFKDHVFQIQNASAVFDNPTVINPSFDMNANTEVNEVRIQMFATGRMDKIKFEFTSHPAMQESEILSLLAVGLTSNDAKKLSATDQTTVQRGEAASLVLHSLDFNRDLEEKTGLQIQLDEFKNPYQGLSAFVPQAQQNSNISPQITVRKKLGKRLSMVAGSTVGVGNNGVTQMSVDFMVDPSFSASGVYNIYTNSGASGTVDTQQNPNNTSFGLDLKFQKRFK